MALSSRSKTIVRPTRFFKLGKPTARWLESNRAVRPRKFKKRLPRFLAIELVDSDQNSDRDSDFPNNLVHNSEMMDVLSPAMNSRFTKSLFVARRVAALVAFVLGWLALEQVSFASCGDYLVHPRGATHGRATGTINQQEELPLLPSAPCQGPGCSQRKDAPPLVPSAPQTVESPSEWALLSIQACGQNREPMGWLLEPDVLVARLMSHCLERPPQTLA